MPQRTFDEVVLPHLDAAFTYARWLTRDNIEAEDVVQDACIRAIRFFPSLRHEQGRAWLLAIVRNSWYSRLARRARITEGLTDDDPESQPDAALGPEDLLLQQATVERVRELVDELPAEFREVLVMRELDGLSYREIAGAVQVPLGTVMSRLSRARARLSALAALDGERQELSA